MKHFFSFLTAVLLSCTAWTVSARTTAMPFLRIDRNPATAGMAGAGIASPYAPAFAVFRNPAVLPFASKSDVAVSWQNWEPRGIRSSHFTLAGGFKMSDIVGITLGASYQDHGTMDLINSDGMPAGTFRPSDLLFGAGFGINLSDNLSAGINARYIQQRSDAESSLSAFSADAFLLYRYEGLTATAGLSSLGPNVKSEGTAYNLPASATAGAAYRLDKGIHALLFAADVDYFFTGGLSGAVGVEYAYDSLVFVRAGLHPATEKAPLPTYAALGLGLQYAGFHIDLSLLTANSVLGNTFSVGLGYCF